MTNRLVDQGPMKTQVAGTGGTTKNMVVCRGATPGEVILPSATDVGGIFGVAQETKTVGLPVDVQTSGFVICIAAGAITAGDYVAVSGTAGKVRSAGPIGRGVVAAARGTAVVGIVGIAQETVTTDGDQVSVLLLGPGLQMVPTAAICTAGTGGVTAAMLCIVGAGGDLGKVILPGSADIGGIVGVARSTVIADASVIVDFAGVVLCTGGAAIIAGAPVSIHGTTGKAKTAAPASGANSFLAGFAQTLCAADNGTFYLEISKSVMQGA